MEISEAEVQEVLLRYVLRQRRLSGEHGGWTQVRTERASGELTVRVTYWATASPAALTEHQIRAQERARCYAAVWAVDVSGQTARAVREACCQVIQELPPEPTSVAESARELREAGRRVDEALLLAQRPARPPAQEAVAGEADCAGAVQAARKEERERCYAAAWTVDANGRSGHEVQIACCRAIRGLSPLAAREELAEDVKRNDAATAAAERATKEVIDLARNLAGLLEAPEPGLATWHQLVGHTWTSLHEILDRRLKR